MADFRYDPARGVYLDARGAPVPAQAIRASLEALVQDSADRLGVLAERFSGGQLGVLDWRIAARAELRTAYGTAASLAQGGLAQMDASARGFLGSQLRTAYGHLDGFALDLLGAGLSPAEIAARLEMYAGGAHATYEAVRARGAPGRGETHERNVLGAADHCDGCLSETARGWVARGELRPIGSRQCLSRCRCWVDRRAAVAVEV